MGRNRIYENPAARQQAYRDRQTELRKKVRAAAEKIDRRVLARSRLFRGFFGVGVFLGLITSIITSHVFLVGVFGVAFGCRMSGVAFSFIGENNILKERTE